MNGIYYSETEYKECKQLQEQITQMPLFELQCTRFNPAETDEQHNEQQYGLRTATDDFQNRACGVDKWQLHVDKV